MLEEASRCQMCGTASWEWDEDKHSYEPMHKFCLGCYYKDIADDDRNTLPGTTVVLIPSSQVNDDMRQAEIDRMREAVA